MDEFQLPKVKIYLHIYLNDHNFTENIKNNLLANIWIDMFNKEFESQVSLADKVNQKIEIDLKDVCISIDSYGFNDTLPLLILNTIRALVSFKPLNELIFNNVYQE